MVCSRRQPRRGARPGHAVLDAGGQQPPPARPHGGHAVGPQGRRPGHCRLDDPHRPALQQRAGGGARCRCRRPLVAQSSAPRRRRRPGHARRRPPPGRRRRARSGGRPGMADTGAERAQLLRRPVLCRCARELHAGADRASRAARRPASARRGGGVMIVGTAGHIDHGKTSLVGRLTGIDTDRLKEEKARGISIDLGFAYWKRPGGETIGFVDVPGHEGLVHNMLAGATGIDFVMLVVAADDGVMPQTREHLAIMDLLGLTRGAVALNKCDLAGADQRAAAIAGIEAVLAGTGLQGAPIVPVSAVTDEGLPALTAILDQATTAATMRPKEGLFRLAVDRSFTLAGLGTAVTGTVLSGAVRLEDRVVVSPSGLEARIRSIHAQNAPVERGEAGQRCALVLSGPHISKEAVRRGDVVLDPTLHLPTAPIDASLRVLPSERKPIGQWFPVKVHHAAAEVPGRVVVLRDKPVDPGETEYVQLVLERPVAAAAGDRFVIRDTSSSRTVGGGV